MTGRRLLGVLAVVAAGASAAALVRAQPSDRMAFIGVEIDGTTRQADRRLAEYLPSRPASASSLKSSSTARRSGGSSTGAARTIPMSPASRRTPTSSRNCWARTSTRSRPTSARRQAGRRTGRISWSIDRSSGSRRRCRISCSFSAAAARDSCYHNEFSTSSFFLPSLFFRSRDVFHMAEKTDRLTAIASAKTEDGGSFRAGGAGREGRGRSRRGVGRHQVAVRNRSGLHRNRPARALHRAADVNSQRPAGLSGRAQPRGQEQDPAGHRRHAAGRDFRRRFSRLAEPDGCRRRASRAEQSPPGGA